MGARMQNVWIFDRFRRLAGWLTFARSSRPVELAGWRLTNENSTPRSLIPPLLRLPWPVSGHKGKGISSFSPPFHHVSNADSNAIPTSPCGSERASSFSLSARTRTCFFFFFFFFFFFQTLSFYLNCERFWNITKVRIYIVIVIDVHLTNVS